MPLGGALSIGSGVLSGIEGIAQIFSSTSKLKKDKEELSKLKRPYYKIQDEYLQNVNTAESLAEGGMPRSQKDFLASKKERGLSTSISSILQGGGSASDISKIFDVYGQGLGNDAVVDSDKQIDNIKYFMEQKRTLAGQKNIQFGVNELQPYESQLKELTERRAADEKNVWGGVNQIIGSASAVGTSLSNQSLMSAQKSNMDANTNFINSLFGSNDPFTITPPSAAEGEAGALPPWLTGQ